MKTDAEEVGIQKLIQTKEMDKRLCSECGLFLMGVPEAISQLRCACCNKMFCPKHGFAHFGDRVETMELNGIVARHGRN